MKTLRVNKVLRTLNCTIESLECLLDIDDINPNEKIVIGRELPMEIIKDKPFDLVDKSNEQLRLLIMNAEQVLQERENKERIDELKLTVNNLLSELKELGVESIIKY